MFTSRAYSGNGLAVVHDADDLDDAAMLAFARETRLSETTFVQRATERGADYRNRIFGVTGELPFAGHPSLGTAVAVARALGQTAASYTQQTLSGLQRINVELATNNARASMLQPSPVLGEPQDKARAAAALSLVTADIHPDLPVVTGSTGLKHLLVPLRDHAALAAASPAAAEHRALTSATGTLVVYAFVAEGEAATARGFFDQGSAIGEDPATGSAAGPLALYVKEHLGAPRIRISQGGEIGRPSVIEAEVTTGGVTVGGDVVVVMDGELTH